MRRARDGERGTTRSAAAKLRYGQPIPVLPPDQPADSAEPRARVSADLPGRARPPHGGGTWHGDDVGQRAARRRRRLRGRARRRPPGSPAEDAARADPGSARRGDRHPFQSDVRVALGLRRQPDRPRELRDRLRPRPAAGRARDPRAPTAPSPHGGRTLRGDRGRHARHGRPAQWSRAQRPPARLARRPGRERPGGAHRAAGPHREFRGGLRPRAHVARAGGARRRGGKPHPRFRVRDGVGRGGHGRSGQRRAGSGSRAHGG